MKKYKIYYHDDDTIGDVVKNKNIFIFKGFFNLLCLVLRLIYIICCDILLVFYK